MSNLWKIIFIQACFGCPLCSVLDFPAYGCLQMPLFISYLVHNRTLQVQEVEVTVEPSDAFMYSGHKQVKTAYSQHAFRIWTSWTSLLTACIQVTNCSNYSRTSTNGHLSTTATSLQRPLFFVPADSPYITSCLNLSTTATATKVRPQLPK